MLAGMTTAETDSRRIRVEVVYAEPGRQSLVSLSLAVGSTAGDAVAAAPFERRFPGRDFSACELGVWGHPVNRDHVLRDGDRVELYRPLQMDPREARRQLAAHGKTMGGHADDDT